MSSNQTSKKVLFLEGNDIFFSSVNWLVPGTYPITYYVYKPGTTTKLTKTFYVRVIDLPDDPNDPFFDYM